VKGSHFPLWKYEYSDGGISPPTDSKCALYTDKTSD